MAMAIGVLLLAVGSYLGGKDHGIGSRIGAGSVDPAYERRTLPASSGRGRLWL
ncbi:MAG: hypothetical protein QOF08_1975 [Gaiellales bacterium]|jgi:hypothetical protein|nr:hypothetical protein [Gaiellales bacterium]